VDPQNSSGKPIVSDEQLSDANVQRREFDEAWKRFYISASRFSALHKAVTGYTGEGEPTTETTTMHAEINTGGIPK